MDKTTLAEGVYVSDLAAALSGSQPPSFSVPAKPDNQGPH